MIRYEPSRIAYYKEFEGMDRSCDGDWLRFKDRYSIALEILNEYSELDGSDFRITSFYLWLREKEQTK
ncbi:MAG: hypothetical protein PF693_10890 [Spirochaetia bacterium]|jgi:hypothetical protein|nr:hypothetical protein [Spirochaetia bacterium]